MQLGPVGSTIAGKLRTAFVPAVLEVVNESSKHAVPRGSETHFKVLVVSDRFEGMTLVQRHRAVNECLKEELSTGGVHALSISAKTVREGEPVIHTTPSCMGGSHARA